MKKADKVQFIRRATSTGQGEINPVRLAQVIEQLPPEQRAALDQMVADHGIEGAADGLALYFRAVRAMQRRQMRRQMDRIA